MTANHDDSACYQNVPANRPARSSDPIGQPQTAGAPRARLAAATSQEAKVLWRKQFGRATSAFYPRPPIRQDQVIRSHLRPDAVRKLRRTGLKRWA
jgi:hypothetical protein